MSVYFRNCFLCSFSLTIFLFYFIIIVLLCVHAYGDFREWDGKKERRGWRYVCNIFIWAISYLYSSECNHFMLIYYEKKKKKYFLLVQQIILLAYFHFYLFLVFCKKKKQVIFFIKHAICVRCSNSFLFRSLLLFIFIIHKNNLNINGHASAFGSILFQLWIVFSNQFFIY